MASRTAVMQETGIGMTTLEAVGRQIRADPQFRWEDITIGTSQRSDTCIVTESEILDFARCFDPLPIHLNGLEASTSRFGALTASGCHMLAIRQRLLYDFAYPGGVVASIGLDEVRYLLPLKANQTCFVEIEFLSKAESRSRPDLGSVTIGMALVADDNPVLTLRDIVLMKRR